MELNKFHIEILSLSSCETLADPLIFRLYDIHPEFLLIKHLFHPYSEMNIPPSCAFWPNYEVRIFLRIFENFAN